MSIEIKFSPEEINALNKLLGSIKMEAYLSEDEVNFFALSPFIISAFEKIHVSYKDNLREKQKSGKLITNQPIDLSSENDFKMSDKANIDNIIKRVKNSADMEYFQKLDGDKLEKYCNLIFAPFKPTSNQKDRMLNLLGSISKES